MALVANCYTRGDCPINRPLLVGCPSHLYDESAHGTRRPSFVHPPTHSANRQRRDRPGASTHYWLVDRARGGLRRGGHDRRGCPCPEHTPNHAAADSPNYDSPNYNSPNYDPTNYNPTNHDAPNHASAARARWPAKRPDGPVLLYRVHVGSGSMSRNAVSAAPATVRQGSVRRLRSDHARRAGQLPGVSARARAAAATV